MAKPFKKTQFHQFLKLLKIWNELSKHIQSNLMILIIKILKLILIMNKILITNSQTHWESTVYTITLEQANHMLPILRSDHFREIIIDNIQGVDTKNLKFMVQLTRLLRTDGYVILRGEASEQIFTLLKNLNLFEGEHPSQNKVFYKTKPIQKEVSKTQKLSIGFQSNQSQQQIDQNQLLKEEGLQIAKKKVQKCQTKPRACANCNCGRKQAEKTVSKEQLIESINEGKPVSGCGKCFLGDSFRCGTCPYKGLPAFKPGDKLKLVQEGGVVVESSSTFVSSTGKVKLEI